MNFCFSVQCDGCGEITNIRAGLSNRHVQPLRFACQDCSATIDITIGGGVEVEGAVRIEGEEPFGDKANFVDLHLDFPTSFEPYVPGNTPFLMAASRVSRDAMTLHARRLKHMDTYWPNVRKFQTLLKHYKRNKVVPFCTNINKTFEIKVASNKQEDINAALYQLIALMMFPYEFPEQSQMTVDDYLKLFSDIEQKNLSQFNSFVDEMVEKEFLKTLQHDALSIFPKMIDAELIMRPALFLDFDETYISSHIPMRVSTRDFEDYRDLYKDIVEIVSRQMILVAGLNNLQKRGDMNAFLAQVSKKGKNLKLKSLDEFVKIDLGKKRSWIDGSWFDFVKDATDNRLRNAIAHNATNYDEITQLITYYPVRSDVQQNQAEEIYFLEFTRRILLAYREMLRLNHLVKGLLYYDLLVSR